MPIEVYTKAEFEEQQRAADGLSNTLTLLDEVLTRSTRVIQAQEKEITRLTEAVTELRNDAEEHSVDYIEYQRRGRQTRDLTHDLLATQERLNNTEMVLRNLMMVYAALYKSHFSETLPEWTAESDSHAYQQAQKVLEGGLPDELVRERYSNPAGQTARSETGRRGAEPSAQGSPEDAQGTPVLRCA